ncbi:MAG: hypothetical protein R2932_00910 [Caldilineaceae bacterium]
MFTIECTPVFWNTVEEHVADAATDLQKLLADYVAPAGQKKIADALLNLRIDLVNAVVVASGATWTDPE